MDSDPKTGQKKMPEAMLVVDHGSRRKAANEALNSVVETLRARCHDRFVTIEPAHMELSTPSIADAIDRCAAAGALHVRVALFFLAPGRHVAEDVPALVADAAASHPGLTWELSAPLCESPALIDAILELTVSG